MIVINDKVCYLNPPSVLIVDFKGGLDNFHKYLKVVGFQQHAKEDNTTYWRNKINTILGVEKVSNRRIRVLLVEHSTKLLGKSFLWFGYICYNAQNTHGRNTKFNL